LKFKQEAGGFFGRFLWNDGAICIYIMSADGNKYKAFWRKILTDILGNVLGDDRGFVQRDDL
jgi:hypothetical protein